MPHSNDSNISSLEIKAGSSAPTSLQELVDPTPTEEPQTSLNTCICNIHGEASNVRISPAHVEEILREKERELREEYERILQREKQQIKDRFNFILLNEQTRSSFMLREAHRERQEKIRALQTQLQCKNLTALMYVMCTERKRSRFEKLKIIEDYTNYINVLHDILTKGQELILHLSRGYKTAARVDHEWREKMKKVVSQFMAFIYHFAGGDPETNQYLIDLPNLLKTEAPLLINPNEDPCECDDDDEKRYFEDEDAESSTKEEWWHDLDKEDAPFIMFGDMGDLEPRERHQILKSVKAQKIKAKKSAPKEWKELSFRDMFLKSECVHFDKIKSLYQERLPIPIKWECLHSPGNGELKGNSRMSIPISNRAASVDIRGTMGSILKMITLGPTCAPVPTKTELLGARDSIEIASMTRVRMSMTSKLAEHHQPEQNVVLNIGKKRASMFTDEDQEEEESSLDLHQPVNITEKNSATNEQAVADELSILGSLHTDSLQMIHSRHPETDHKINYERVCPMDKCQRLQVDSFMRSLPPYMTANPFTHFEQTFEEYETCTPEQLAILQQRIDNKLQKESKKALADESGLESPLSEWFSTGVAVQTSEMIIPPPCVCYDQPPKTPPPKDFVFDLADLEMVKVAMDAIHRECLFSDKIEFDRFKVIGKESESKEQKQQQPQNDAEFKEGRYQEISNILNKHPSLLDIFQANAK